MSEQPMDRFDAKLVDLLTAYGDRAAVPFDAAAIAHVATTHRGRLALRLELARRPWLRALIVVGLVALLVAIAIVAASPHRRAIGDSFASPTALAWSPDGSLLAFLVDVADQPDGRAGGTSGPASPGNGAAIRRAAHAELWVVDPHGGSPRRLADFGSLLHGARLMWTHNGRSIVVGLAPKRPAVAHSLVVSVGLDGSPPRTLIDSGADDAGIYLGALSPTGDRVLYLRTGPGGDDLYVLDLAAAASRRLTTSGSVCCSGDWSPDGTWILYSDGVAGGTQTPDAATRVVSADGSTSRRLGPCCDVGWASGSRAYFEDGTTLYATATDGSAVGVVEGSGPVSEWVPSPDGTRILAASSRGIEILAADGSWTSLTSDPGDENPQWSPDGTWVAFLGQRSGLAGLYVVPQTGGEPRLVASSVQMVDVSWRPGPGRTELTLVRDRAVVTVGPDGAGARDLVSRSAIAGDPLAGGETSDIESTIVIGPNGPQRDIERLVGGDAHGVLVENRSNIAWTPWGLGDKNFECTLLAGQEVPGNPCVVGPGATVEFPGAAAPGLTLQTEIAPFGAPFDAGFPVILDLVAQP